MCLRQIKAIISAATVMEQYAEFLQQEDGLSVEDHSGLPHSGIFFP